MTRARRAILTLVGTVAAVSLLTSTAFANHLSTSTRSIRNTWAPLEFVEVAGRTFKCSVTIEGSLHSATITKTPELLIGFITRATLINPCVGGRATFLQGTLPWHLRYAGFEGSLPEIRSVVMTAIGWSFQLEGSCLFASTASQPIRLRYNLNVLHAVTGVEVIGSTISREGCGPFGETVTDTLRGNSATNTAQTITLI